MRHGDVFAGKRIDVRGRHDDGELLDDGGTVLLVHGDCNGRLLDHVPGEHHGLEYVGPVRRGR